MTMKHFAIAIAPINYFEILVNQLEKAFIDFKSSNYRSEPDRYIYFYQSVSEALKGVDKDQHMMDISSIFFSFLAANEIIKSMSSSSFDSNKTELNIYRHSFKELCDIFQRGSEGLGSPKAPTQNLSEMQKIRSILHEINVICKVYTPNSESHALKDIESIRDLIETGKKEDGNYLWE